MFTNGHHPRVVITGMGAVSAIGNNLPTIWDALLNGVCGVEAITKFDTTGYLSTIAATVKDFNPLDYMDKRDARRMAPFIHFATAAAHEALSHATLDLNHTEPTRVGVEIGSGIGGIDVIEEQREIISNSGPKKVNPTTIPAMLINMAGCFIAMQHNILGPVNAPVSACATGLSGIGEGAKRIAFGEADVMLVGGTESAVTPVTVSAFGRMTALSRRNDTPHRAITPFDASRDGTVLGEGAGVLVLESLEHAQARGATILAEVKSFALTSDAHHISSPREDGYSASRAMQIALRNANVAPEQVDYIGAHGTGTPLNDATETRVIKKVLGEAAYNIPITSIKSMTGHTLGAAGALSAVAAVQAMTTGTISPTINLHTPDPDCDLDYVPNEPRPADVNIAMINAFGFGGQNACIVLERWNGQN